MTNPHILPDMTFDECRLLDEMRRLSVRADVLSIYLEPALQWAEELQRLQWASGEDRAAGLERATNGGARMLRDLLVRSGPERVRIPPAAGMARADQ